MSIERIGLRSDSTQVKSLSIPIAKICGLKKWSIATPNKPYDSFDEPSFELLFVAETWPFPFFTDRYRIFEEHRRHGQTQYWFL